MIPFRLACQRFAWNGRKCKHPPARHLTQNGGDTALVRVRPGAPELAPFHSAPLRGLEEERPLGCLLETIKNSIARKFPMSFLIRSIQRPNALLRELS